jgi:Asp-tRNA(Asn)/Glu-tRNA(Gln) amidotransferase A subunit family amidase
MLASGHEARDPLRSGVGQGLVALTMASDLLELTLVELGEALRSRRASAVELMEAVLGAVDATHEALNALSARRPSEELLAEARAADRRIERGEARALEGVPMAVKDLEDAAGLVTSHGSLLFRDNLAARDSIQVARLKAAGAIVVGKSNTPEFGHTAITRNLLFGVTRSPWDGERSPGGSSGGAAALMAAEVMPLVTASDGGGSIRIPASFSGCFGLKPSFGRIPKGPSALWDYDATSVVGPISKTVEDAALILDLVAGHHPLDPTSLPHPGLSYRAILEDAPRGLRLGFSSDLGYGVVQSDVAACVEEAARALGAQGHALVPIADGPPEMGADWGLVNAFFLAAEFAPHLPERASDITRAVVQVIDMARAMPASWWGDSLRRRRQVASWCAEVFERCDILLTPTVPYDPPPARGPLWTETEGRPQPAASAGSFTIPFNLAWLPAATVRAGLSRAGLPVGLQIVGPRYRDDLVLQVARAFERERPWHPRWPGRRRP